MALLVQVIDAAGWYEQLGATLDGAGMIVMRGPYADGAARLRRRPPDHIVLVDDPPRVDAVALLPWLMQCTGALITVVTRPHPDERMLAAFAAGADDVVPADCEPRLFLTRMRALLRRSTGVPIAPRQRLAIGGIVVEDGQAWIAGWPVHLTPCEFALLRTLMRDPGVVYSREDLLDLVWGRQHAIAVHTVDAHISKLRRKIESAIGYRWHIVSVARYGYRFRRPDERRPARVIARIAS